jgi:RND superfamily putative drug exporter
MNKVSTTPRDIDETAANPSDQPRLTAWGRLGRFGYRRRWPVLAVWLAALVLVSVFSNSLGPASRDGGFSIPASESKSGFDTLDTYFGGVGGGRSGSIVFRADKGVDDPTVKAAMTTLFDQVAKIKDVTITSPYSPEGQARGLVATNGPQAGLVATAPIELAQSVNDSRGAAIGSEIEALVPRGIDGLQVEIGGRSLSKFQAPSSEFIGIAFAIVILILAFGSVLAMGLPIGVALFGVGIGVGLITLLSHLTTVPDFATTLGAMIGLGVGIDYALFIVTRYREGLKAGESPEQATITAIDTSGRAVVFAGFTVVISLLGMFIMGLPFVNGLATGAATTVLITMIASVTLLPAFLGFAQHRIEVTRWRGLIAAGLVAIALLGAGLGIQPLLVGAPIAVVVVIASFAFAPLRREVPARRERALRDTVAYRWSRFVQHHSWPMAIGTTVLLLLLAIPVLGLRLGFSDESNFPANTTTRKAFDLTTEAFGAGQNGPFVVTAELPKAADLAVMKSLAGTIGQTPGVSAVKGPIPNDQANPQAAIIQVIPTTGPQDAATENLLKDLRHDVIPKAVQGTDVTVNVTGSVAANIDFSSYLAKRILIFFAAVLTLSFLLLMMVFRSLLVPLKAVIMNMLSIGAAYGIVVMVFQWGWGASLFNTAGGPIEPFIPMMMFAIVFGLSMDYEVFLLSRVKEEYDRTGDAVNSVADGLALTARVITAAAAIMVVVFASFVLEDNRVVKLFGLGLAVAVMLDATLVRMLLVPATMELLGERNWWLPKWLGRLLPTLNVEGGTHSSAVSLDHDREVLESADDENESELVDA